MPRFPPAFWDVPFLCLGVPSKTYWAGGRALKESPGETERSRNTAAVFHQHVEGAETTPEMRCGDNWSPLQRTLRKHATARVTGTSGWQGGELPLSSVPAQGKCSGKPAGLLPRYTHYQHQGFFLRKCFFSSSSLVFPIAEVRGRMEWEAELYKLQGCFCILRAHLVILTCSGDHLTNLLCKGKTLSLWSRFKIMQIFNQSSKQNQKSFINSTYPESCYRVNKTDHIVSVPTKLLLTYSTGQQNNTAVHLISRVLLSAFVTHKHSFVQITLFSFLPLLVLFPGAIFLVPFRHFLQVSPYCNYASLLSKYTSFGTEIQRLGLHGER